MRLKPKYEVKHSTTPYLAQDLNKLVDDGYEIFQVLPQEGADPKRRKEYSTEWLIIYVSHNA